jgi:hypothetical protein
MIGLFYLNTRSLLTLVRTSEKQRRRAMGDDLDKKKGWEQAPDDSGLVSFPFSFFPPFFLKRRAGSIRQMTLAWSL